jgi:hypothetical protein
MFSTSIWIYIAVVARLICLSSLMTSFSLAWVDNRFSMQLATVSETTGHPLTRA